MGFWDTIKKAYTSIDKKVGGILPGGYVKPSSSSTTSSSSSTTSTSTSTSSGGSSGGGGSSGSGSVTTQEIAPTYQDSVIVTDTNKGSVTTYVDQSGRITGRTVEYVQGTNPDNLVTASTREGGLVEQQQTINANSQTNNTLQPATNPPSQIGPAETFKQRIGREVYNYGPINTLTLELGSAGRKYIGGALNINNPSGYQSRALGNFGYLAGSILPYANPYGDIILIAKGGEDILYPGGAGFKTGILEIGIGALARYSQIRNTRGGGLAAEESSVTTISTQTAKEGAGGVREIYTKLSFESVSGDTAGYVNSITRQTAKGGFETKSIGVVGEPGAPVSTGDIFVGGSRGASRVIQGRNIYYESQGLTAYENIDLSYSQSIGVSGQPKGQLYVPGGIKTVYKNTQGYVSEGFSLGNKNVQFVTGRNIGTSGNVNYAGFNFRLQNSITKIDFSPSSSSLTFSRPSNEFYQTALKQTQSYAADISIPKQSSTTRSGVKVAPIIRPSQQNLPSTIQTSTLKQEYTFSSSSIVLPRLNTEQSSGIRAAQRSATVSLTSLGLVSLSRETFSTRTNTRVITTPTTSQRFNQTQIQIPGFPGFPGFSTDFNRPRESTDILPPFFTFGGLRNNIAITNVGGGKRQTSYTPSFNAIFFNIKGAFKGGGALAKSGINFRPITPGFKFNTGLGDIRLLKLR